MRSPVFALVPGVARRDIALPFRAQTCLFDNPTNSFWLINHSTVISPNVVGVVAQLGSATGAPIIEPYAPAGYSAAVIAGQSAQAYFDSALLPASAGVPVLPFVANATTPIAATVGSGALASGVGFGSGILYTVPAGDTAQLLTATIVRTAAGNANATDVSFTVTVSGVTVAFEARSFAAGALVAIGFTIPVNRLMVAGQTVQLGVLYNRGGGGVDQYTLSFTGTQTVLPV